MIDWININCDKLIEKPSSEELKRYIRRFRFINFMRGDTVHIYSLDSNRESLVKGFYRNREDYGVADYSPNSIFEIIKNNGQIIVGTIGIDNINRKINTCRLVLTEKIIESDKTIWY